MKQTITFALCLAIIALSSSVIFTKALPTNTLHLGYDNGTYSTVLTGSYSSLYRVDNIWFVNGVPLEASASTDDTDAALALGFLGLVIGVCAFAVVAVKKRGRGEN